MMAIRILSTEVCPEPVPADRTRYVVTADVPGLGLMRLRVLRWDMAPGGVRDGLEWDVERFIRGALQAAGFEFIEEAELDPAGV